MAADKTIGCGPAAFSTGPDDPFFDICAGHDKIDDMINAGDPGWDHETNDYYFERNMKRRQQELQQAGKSHPLRAFLYPKLVKFYRWLKK